MDKAFAIPAFALLAAAAVAGWARKPEAPTMSPFAGGMAAVPYATVPVGYVAVPANYAMGAAQPIAFTQPGFAQPAGVPARSAVYTSRIDEARPLRVVRRQKRSTAKSVAIVAGGAGAGAAIGGLAGGKKGAGIGAISGGVAGLVYDQMTRNPR